MGISAPFGMANGTAGAAGSTGLAGTATITGTSQVTIYSTIYQAAGGAQATASEAAAVGTGAESGDTCGGTSTVTVNGPAVTVTVTGGAAPAESAVAVPSPASVEAGAPPVASSVTPEAIPSGPASTSQALAEAETAAPIPANTEAKVVPSSSSAAEVKAPSAAVAAASVASSAVATPQVKAATSSGATSSGSKRGLVMPIAGKDTPSLVAAFNNQPKISWTCNWFSIPPDGLSDHIEYVPQDYGIKQSEAGWWDTNAKKAVSEGHKNFLSFGEPGADTTAADERMGAQEAANLWLKEMQPYAEQGVNVGAPGNLQSPVDFDYLESFLSYCTGCDIGFIALHWVWSATKTDQFKVTVNNATRIASGMGKKVWIDNLQAYGSDADQHNFYAEILPWLDSNDLVERYAILTPDRTTGGGLLNQDGSISDLGVFFATV